MIYPRPSPNTHWPVSRDDKGCGDHDAPYTFGPLPSVAAPFPFSTRQFARLLILKYKVPADETADGRRPFHAFLHQRRSPD
jgi:hypothetical protein